MSHPSKSPSPQGTQPPRKDFSDHEISINLKDGVIAARGVVGIAAVVVIAFAWMIGKACGVL